MYELQKAIQQASTEIAHTLTEEGGQVRALREYNREQRDRDPAKIAWAATLPIELALKTASPQELRIHYGYTDEEWEALRQNPTFMTELAAACDMVKQEGMSFKLKCRLQAEALLETGWRLIHAPHSEVSAATKEKLMAGVYRMAGFDNKSDGNGGVGGGTFAIQINLGS